MAEVDWYQTTPQNNIAQSCACFLTHWGWDKIAAIFQTTFSNEFSWMKVYKFWLKISLRFVPKGPINNIPALFQIMALHRPGDKPLSEPMMVSLLTHIGSVSNSSCGYNVIQHIMLLHTELKRLSQYKSKCLLLQTPIAHPWGWDMGRFYKSIIFHSIMSEWVIKFNSLSGDSGQRGPYSPHQPSNHSLYNGFIIFPLLWAFGIKTRYDIWQNHIIVALLSTRCPHHTHISGQMPHQYHHGHEGVGCPNVVRQTFQPFKLLSNDGKLITSLHGHLTYNN